VPAGTVYALLGRNGAGKTSLVQALLGFTPTAAGRVRVLGLDPWRCRADLLRRVGVLAEADDAPPDVSVGELLRFCARVHPRWDGEWAAQRLAGWELAPALAFGRLSRGQRRLVQLVLALGQRPELLVLDDPTLGLDAVARRLLFEELVGELAERGTTVLICTHDLAAVEGLAGRVGILDRGRLLLDEEREALRGRFRCLDLQLSESADLAALEGALADLGPLCGRRLGQRLALPVARWDPVRWRALQHRPEVARALAVPPEEPAALTLEELFLTLCGGGR